METLDNSGFVWATPHFPIAAPAQRLEARKRNRIGHMQRLDRARVIDIDVDGAWQRLIRQALKNKRNQRKGATGEAPY
jgi:hypothetical protein